MGKFCANCGNELPENAALCVKCGKEVEGAFTNNKVEVPKKKGLPAWAIVLIVVGSVVVVGIVCFTILLSSIFKFGSDLITESAESITGSVEKYVDKDSINDYMKKFEEQMEQQFDEKDNDLEEVEENFTEEENYN